MILIKFILTSLIISSNLFAGELEEQRKYIFEDQSSKFEEFISEGYLDGLSVKGHSTYEYFDMYLDTPNLELFNNGLSLRIRKRIFATGEIEFGIQLKSEMIKNGQARMEVEEDELNFYKVYHNHTTYSLQNTLSEIFNEFEKIRVQDTETKVTQNLYIMKRIEILKSWLKFKTNAPIAPFQKLKRLKIQNISMLRPTVIGKSIRKRSHIFINLKNTTEDYETTLPSSRSQIETPVFVQGKNKIWTMETSLDTANFYDLVSHCPKVSINEYEVENKYLPNSNGIKFMENFEQGLKESFKAIVNLESKYKQTINILKSCISK